MILNGAESDCLVGKGFNEKFDLKMAEYRNRVDCRTDIWKQIRLCYIISFVTDSSSVFCQRNQSAGAFSGWHVLLCVGSTVRQHGFKRMLEAGNGTVASIHPPFNALDGVTHAFIGNIICFLVLPN